MPKPSPIIDRLTVLREEIMVRYRTGEGADHIAPDYDCCPSTLLRAIRLWGESPHNNHHSDDKRNEIIRLGADGCPPVTIAKQTGISITQVSCWLSKSGITTPRQQTSRGHRSSVEENKDEIIKLYDVDKIGSQAIGDRFGIPSISVIRALREWGVITRSKRDYAYDVNESFFDEISDEPSAYSLGVIMADGCVTSTKKTLCLSMTDRDVVYSVAKAMSYKGPVRETKIRDGRTKPQHEIRIGSERLHSALGRLGCHPRKSWSATFPTEEQVPKHLHSHLIRGWFDGDGAIYRFQCPRGYVRWEWFICGTEPVCRGISKAINNAIGIQCYLASSNASAGCDTWKAKLSAKDEVRGVLAWLYKDATIYMDRKYRKYQEFLEDKFPDAATPRVEATSLDSRPGMSREVPIVI